MVKSLYFIRILSVLAGSLLAPSVAHAAAHTWSGAVSGNWGTAGNWSAGGVPVLGEASITLSFPGSATRTVMTNNIGALAVTSMNFSGSNYVLRGASALSFNPAILQILCTGNSNVIESTLNLSNFFAVSVADDRILAFHTLTGPGSLTKFGEGQLHLRGAAANTLSGEFNVNVGALVLDKTGGATAVAGPLTIIGTTNFGEIASVRLFSSEQIAGNVNVTIHPTGILNLNGFTNTINHLTVMAGSVFPDGLLRLNGSLTLSAQDNTFPATDVSPLITGSLEFIGAASTITVSNLTCEIEANIVEYGGATTLTKEGPGTLWLKGGGNNPGNIFVNAGTLRAEQNTSLGTATGTTTVAPGATLILGAGTSTSESLNLAGSGIGGQGALQIVGGTVECYGNVNLTNQTTVRIPAAGELQLKGSLIGAGGLTKIGDGELHLAGLNGNTFAGTTFVNSGKLSLFKTAGIRALGSVTVTNGATLALEAGDQMDNAGVLSLYTGAAFSMANFNETIGGLNLGGGAVLDSGTGTLTLLGTTYVGAPYSATNTPAAVRGKLSLGGATRNFQADDQYQILNLDCAIADGGIASGLSLSNGTFGLLRSNLFTGPVWLNGASTCNASNAFAFGVPGGGIIATGGIINLVLSNVVVSGESLSVAGPSVGFKGLGSNVWNGPITVLESQTVLYYTAFMLSGTRMLTLNGPIAGPCELLYLDGGTLILTASNSYTGPTLVSGAGFFSSPAGVLVIRHPHALGSSAQGTTVNEGNTLQLQLPDGAEVVGESLTFISSADPLQDALRHLGVATNTWSGPITNSSSARISVHAYNGALRLNTAIAGGGNLIKDGLGRLILGGTGTNQVEQLTALHGRVDLDQQGGYAISGGNVVVAGNDFLEVDGVNYSAPGIVSVNQSNQLPPSAFLNLIGPEGIFIVNSTLQIAKLAGAGSLTLNCGTLTVSNQAFSDSFFYGYLYGYGCLGTSPTNLIKQGLSELHLLGPSSSFFNGSGWQTFEPIIVHGWIAVQGGTLVLTNGVIDALDISANALVQMTGSPNSPNVPLALQIGILTGAGSLAFSPDAVTAIGWDLESSVFNGVFSGPASAKFHKVGKGSLTLNSSVNPFAGTTEVVAGALLVNGTLAGPVRVEAASPGIFATLGGTGQVGNVTVTGLFSRIAPGPTTNLFSFGRLRVGTFTHGPNAGFQCEVSGTNAGVNMDQIDASGAVSLTGGFLDLSATGATAVSNRYDLVKSPTPVSGTFLNDPEGDYFFPGPGRIMTITYLTAGGTRVSMVEQPGAPPSNIHITGITGQTNGHITLTGTGIIGATYFIEANTNLRTTNWITVGSVMPNFNGDITFTDTNTPAGPEKYYRFQQQ